MPRDNGVSTGSNVYFATDSGGVAAGVVGSGHTSEIELNASNYDRDFTRKNLSFYFKEIFYANTVVHVKLDGSAYSSFTKTVKLIDTIDSARSYTGTFSNGDVSFASVAGGIYHIYVDNVDTGTDFTVQADAASADLNYSSLFSLTLNSNAPTPGTAIGVSQITLGTGGALSSPYPSVAPDTISFQWYSSGDGNTWSPIAGATGASYTPQSADLQKYLRCTATGNGKYVGAASINTDQVKPTIQSATISLHPTSPYLAAGAVIQVSSVALNGGQTPTISSDNFTFDWQYSSDGTTGWTSFSPMQAGTYYTVAAGDLGRYIRCVVSGKSGVYLGSANSNRMGPVKMLLKSAGLDTATPATGLSIAVNSVTKSDDTSITLPSADLTYQWQVSVDGATGWTNAAGTGAATQSYTPANAEAGKYLRCGVTGINTLVGTVYATTANPIKSSIASATLQPAYAAVDALISVSKIQLKDVSNSEVNVDTINFDYQWQSSGDGVSNWSNIVGAISIEYTPGIENWTTPTYLRCFITGKNNYAGTAYTAMVRVQMPVASVTLNKNATYAGDTIFVQSVSDIKNGTVAVNGTNLTYLWQVRAEGSAEWANAAGTGATASSYTPVQTEVGKYLRCVVTGQGSYIGSQFSEAANVKIAPASAALGSNTAALDQSIAVLKITLNDAVPGTQVNADTTNFEYQWQIKDGSSWVAASNADNKGISYTPIGNDWAKQLRCVITGKGLYAGSTSAAISGIVTRPITSATLSFQNPVVGTAVAVSSVESGGGSVGSISTDVTFQWKVSDNGTDWANAAGSATAQSYTPVIADLNKYLKCEVTGVAAKGYMSTVNAVANDTVKAALQSGTVGSNYYVTNPQILSKVLVDIGNSSSQEVMANTTDFTYQWRRSKTSSGTFEDIAGATTPSYTPVIADITYWLECFVTGHNMYTGSASMKTTEAIQAMPLSSATISRHTADRCILASGHSA